MRRLDAFVVLGVLVGAVPALAKGTSGEPRFPATVSDAVMTDFLRVGRVEAPIPRDPESWLRWGGAPVEHQASAMRAVVDALSVARPQIGVAAAILTIARVESGWNPYARNPTSTACGLFQFIRATWESYDDSQDRCFDVQRNASAGVKHLLGLYQSRVLPRMSVLVPVTTEEERVALIYRMLYAFHYHGEVAPEALAGGSAESQAAADAAMGHLQGYLTVLKRVTTVRPTRRVRTPVRVRKASVPAGSGKARARG